MLAHGRRSSAPTGRNATAQGNALGLAFEFAEALKGRHNQHGENCIALSGLET
jgi:hypothetical protein